MNPIAKEMYARTTADSETAIRVGVGVVVRNQTGEILLEKRSDCSMWGLPGGKVEAGESIEQAAKREVMEETGLHIEITRLLGVYSEPHDRIVTYPDNGDVVHLVDVLLEAIPLSDTLRISDESEELQFFEAEHLPPDIVPPAQAPVNDYVRGLTSIIR